MPLKFPYSSLNSSPDLGKFDAFSVNSATF